MPEEHNNLAVRRHDRRPCKLAAVLSVAEEHAGQVAFSRAVSNNNATISLGVVDCSEGGLGLRSPVYIPRGAQIFVDIAGHTDGRDVMHRVELRVQRVTMIDRSPAYYLGTSLVDRAESAPAIRDLLAISDAQQADDSRKGAVA